MLDVIWNAIALNKKSPNSIVAYSDLIMS